MRQKFEQLENGAKEQLIKLFRNGDIPQILIGSATCGRAAGALSVLEAVKKKVKERNIEVSVKEVGCIGFCFAEVLVDIIKPGMPRICYSQMTPEKAKDLVEDYLVNNNPRPDFALGYFGEAGPEGIPKINELPMFKKQLRVILRNCGNIDPGSIDEYIVHGGYRGFFKALGKPPEEIIDIVILSGLRGRGGAGFPTGLKWASCRAASGDQKYVICNADEGDPGAFMDRSVLESDPHAVIEGMLIAGYAIGATKGIIYVRAEYPLAILRLKNAIAQARQRNLLGDNILGQAFNFDLEIFQGAGAFVCGESTALILSIEGNRGMPKPFPRPRTTEAGLKGKPTLLNNVKTLASVPQIIEKGANWFSAIGTNSSPGTAVFALTGKIKNSGLIEVPMGTKLHTVIYEIGGGIIGGRKFKAVQTGGPSGGCLPESRLGLPVDFDSLIRAGSMMGSGGMVVLDETTCMVDLARYYLDFNMEESCGQCTPCRLGTHQMLQILNDICAGKGKEEDIDLLLQLGDVARKSSICGLGQTVPNPVLTTIRYFREEYENHIKEKKCTAYVCKNLITYRIAPEKCTGCGFCCRYCPVDAISGVKNEPYRIDPEKCTRCGICFEICPVKFEAVECVTGGKKSIASVYEGGKS